MLQFDIKDKNKTWLKGISLAFSFLYSKENSKQILRMLQFDTKDKNKT